MSARVVRPSDKVGALTPGFLADFVALDGDPTKSVSILLDRRKVTSVFKGGAPMAPGRREYDPRRVSDFAMTISSDLYTRERVAELGHRKAS